MSDIKFGMKSLQQPTPQWMKNVFKTILYLTGLWALLAPMLTNIPENTSAEVNKWCLISLSILRFTIAFFRYDFSETED